MAVEITTQGRHVHFREGLVVLPRPLCGREPDHHSDVGVCGACLSVLTGNDLTALPVHVRRRVDTSLQMACETLYGPDPEPIPLADLVERSRKVPTT